MLTALTEDRPRLLRIQEVAAETGLTARSIRYYEEIGLLKPAARSEAAYRLYDDDDLERLRFIRGLRDDAGFSLAEIGQLLEDEAARVRHRERFRASHDLEERRALLHDGIRRVDRQVATLRTKIERIESMITESETRRAHLEGHLAEIEAELESTPAPGDPHKRPADPDRRPEDPDRRPADPEATRRRSRR